MPPETNAWPGTRLAERDVLERELLCAVVEAPGQHPDLLVGERPSFVDADVVAVGQKLIDHGLVIDVRVARSASMRLRPTPAGYDECGTWKAIRYHELAAKYPDQADKWKSEASLLHAFYGGDR